MTIGMPRIDRAPAQERGVTIGDFLVPIRVSERLHARARHLVLILLGTAIIALSARVSILIPGNPVPITGQTFGVLLVAGALGFRRGLAATILYLAIGALGVPVFAEGRHGTEVLLGVTGGYLVGFMLAAAIVGLLAELGWDRNLAGGLGAMLIGSAAIYLIGVPWLAFAAYDGDLQPAVANGLVPFLLWDAVKLALAAGTFRLAWWVVGRRPGDR